MLSLTLKTNTRILSKDDFSESSPKKLYQYYVQLVSFIGDEIENNHIKANNGRGPYSFCLVKFMVISEEFKKKAHSNIHGHEQDISGTNFVFIKKLVNGTLCDKWNIEVPSGESYLDSIDDEQKTFNFDSDSYYQIEIDVDEKKVSFFS